MSNQLNKEKDDHLKWKVLSSEYITNHMYFTARKDVCQRQDGTMINEYFVVELPRTATALALTEDNRVVLTRQYRHPIQQVLIETPGGFIDEGEDYVTGIRRELLEETGYEFKEVHHLAAVAANPGVLSGITDLYLATGGVKISGQSLDHNEEIEILLITLEELVDLLRNNQIIQSLHANCIFYALLKMGKLQFTAS